MKAPFYAKFVHLMIGMLYLASMVALIMMMVIVVANIIGRMFFNAPIMGTIEIAGLAGVVVVSAAMGITERRRRNIMVDIVVNRFSRGLRSVIDSLTRILSLVAVGFLFWAVAESAMESLARDEITLTLALGIFPFRATWACGLLVLLCFLFLHLIQALTNALKK